MEVTMSLPEVVSHVRVARAPYPKIAAHGTYPLLNLTALGRQEDWEEPKGRAVNAGKADPSFA
jgi:hypothetical protein